MTPSEEAVALRRHVVAEQSDRVTLVNRSNERELMQLALDEAQAGSGSFVLLTGVAGIGKTSLGQWLVDRAEQNGWISGQAVASSVDGPWPYAPVLEAIDNLLCQTPELLDDLPESHRVELLRVRDAPRSPHDGGGDDGHQRLFVAVDELVRLASQSRGVVLFIDDLHAADDASLALLHYIARQAGRSRLILLGTARSGYLGMAEHSATAWQGTAWPGAIAEAKGHVARAEGRADDAEGHWREAIELFTRAGQPLDVKRCEATARA